jgi:methionyl-tRNA formyltransferase
MTSAVVFAYHNVGVRCLSVLLNHGINVSLVLTHEDNPAEEIWFGSVAAIARRYDIPVIAPSDPNEPSIIARIAALQPEFLFSFYYRLMLNPTLLGVPTRGAYNVHGSLLPKYRNRVPVNWAIIKGEKESGATLHEMVEKPDAGRIVDQQAVPILADDTAAEVFNKVTVAAEMVLYRSLPRLLDGTQTLTPQDLRRGSYFAGRKPEDGVINWLDSARNIHNLVRAVTSPYPGARTMLQGLTARVLRTLHASATAPRGAKPVLYVDADRLLAQCGDGGVLRIVELEVEGRTMTPQEFTTRFGTDDARTREVVSGIL